MMLNEICFYVHIITAIKSCQYLTPMHTKYAQGYILESNIYHTEAKVYLPFFSHQPTLPEILLLYFDKSNVHNETGIALKKVIYDH